MTSYRTIRRTTRNSLDEKRSFMVNRQASSGPDRFVHLAWRQEDGDLPGDDDYWPPKVIPFKVYRLVNIFCHQKQGTYSFRVDYNGSLGVFANTGTETITQATEFPYYFTENIIFENNMEFTLHMITSSNVEHFESIMELQEL